jgi:hypothetical protein
MLALPMARDYTPGDLSGWSTWRFDEKMIRGYQ